jgi:hypothetical protein
MILELGKVSVETKGLVPGLSKETINGQVRPYQP